ncbi:MAG TPA: undecaprenyl-phosphate glucose phosphotransferase [Vicinamibacterales bacterium]|jgi:Undecaprenyl-phosphate glucose phosphotransferase|nr:undecaprenyl-phosphate glucose phosphotransferase [Acidobacteriota bacterium]MDP7470991.1 undecaprenyl-phosphate glucose phosphotransferase [Vicinamibacterales bacterium]HJO37139.1 undecaprenyl-phosphate glucose phosphotransferase [Vicinamibacterales bacterium]
MVKRFARLLVALHVVSDALLGMAAFVLAYVVRFETGLIPVTRGFPPFQQYLNVLPLIGLVVPIAFQIHGMYRLRRHRSRIDDFFGVFVGSVIAVVFGIGSTLYVQTYFLPPELKERGAFEVSQLVWALFLVLNTLLCYGVRELVREVFERRWRAGIGLKRLLIAGSGELGRLVADKALQHRELGYRVVGFLDDRAEQDHLGYRGLPLLGTLADIADLLHREQIDLLYITLPLEEHVKMLSLIEAASRECVEVKVVPDLLQFIALKAGLEDLDGVPIISVNDVPLHGMNSALKRVIDVGLSTAALVTLSAPMAAIALLVRYSSPGPVLYRQERMGLDGRSFTVYKFRSMHNQAEASTGPVWARDNDPRRTLLGGWLRRFNLDELPQLWNVWRGDMSLVGPRPERPYFVEKFKHRFPQYMLRHKVKAGMTGWAQVNGWRGNTSIEKRIEFDLYYIENWSVALDFKILWLTVVRGLFQTHAY